MEPNRRRARVRQGMLARTPSASRAGLLARLRQQDQARHQQVTKHLRQTRETQKFEAHRPQWQVSWRLENVSVARAGMGLQLSQRLLSCWCFKCFMAAHTNRNAETSRCKR